MKLPSIRGTIERRILANYRIDPNVVSAILPRPFRPKQINGFAIGGICLIRLKAIRPRFFPFPWGIGSENAAHRIAVEWDVDDQIREGVFIPRRDTSSVINTLVGGRIFPGVHHRASFDVKETNEFLSLNMNSKDDKTHVAIAGAVTDRFPTTSIFSTLSNASDFFRRGSVGYSVSPRDGIYDGLELRCQEWKMESFCVEHIESSYFDDRSRFPAGSIHFDNALIMRQIEHEWLGHGELCCPITEQLPNER